MTTTNQDKKYELLTDDTITFCGKNLYRIRALKDFKKEKGSYYVKKGELGGYVASEKNLSHEGTAWVTDKALVTDNALVTDDALIEDNTLVKDNAKVTDNALVKDNAKVTGNALIKDNAKVTGSAIIKDNALVKGDCLVTGNASVGDDAQVKDNAYVIGHSIVAHSSIVESDALIKDGKIFDNALISGNAIIDCDATIAGDAQVFRSGDYQVFKIVWDKYCSDANFTYTNSNKMWWLNGYHLTGEELIELARHKEGEVEANNYKAYVELVEKLEQINQQ